MYVYIVCTTTISNFSGQNPEKTNQTKLFFKNLKNACLFKKLYNFLSFPLCISCSPLEVIASSEDGTPGCSSKNPATNTELALSTVTSQIVNNSTYKLDFKQRRHKNNNNGSEGCGNNGSKRQRRKSSCTSCGGAAGSGNVGQRLTPEEALTAAAHSAAAAVAWQQQPQNSVTSAGSTNSSYSSGAKDDDSSYSAVGGDSSSSNSCNCDITGDNSTLHGFGVGDISSFIGDEDCVGGDDDDPDNPDAADLSSQTLRTAAIVAAVAAAAKEKAAVVDTGHTDRESFTKGCQDAADDTNGDTKIIASTEHCGNDSLEDVQNVDDNEDVIVRRNTLTKRFFVRRSCRISDEEDNENNHGGEEFDEDEPEGTTIDIDEQEELAQQYEEYNEQDEEDDIDVEGGDDEEADEYYEEEEDDTQAFTPFYSSSAELIDNFGGGAGKFFNIMDFERGGASSSTFTPNGNKETGLGEMPHSLNTQADLGGGTNIMGNHSSLYYTNCLSSHLLAFLYRHRYYGYCKHSGNNERYHNWTQWRWWSEAGCCRRNKATAAAWQTTARSTGASPFLSRKKEPYTIPLYSHCGMEVSFFNQCSQYIFLLMKLYKLLSSNCFMVFHNLQNTITDHSSSLSC